MVYFRSHKGQPVGAAGPWVSTGGEGWGWSAWEEFPFQFWGKWELWKDLSRGRSSIRQFREATPVAELGGLTARWGGGGGSCARWCLRIRGEGRFAKL